MRRTSSRSAAGSRPARGAQLAVALQPDRVTFRYDGLDGVRMGTHLAFSEPCADVGAVDPDVAGSANAGWIRMTWRWDLASGEARELRWLAWTTERPRPDPGHPDDSDALFPARPMADEDRVTASYRAWNSSFTKIRTDNELFNLSIDRSAGDLRLLINDGPRPDERYIAAGVPWFTTLFGRDSLITAFQTLAVRPQIAIETLETLAAFQATEDDPERDMEPGKILHELRTGEMARNRETPHRPYYGTVDATPLWLILFGAAFDWTGDRSLVDRLWPNALRALEWIDRYGDRDGDGFVEYERRTPHGLVNQGWKDSSDCIRDRHGRLAQTPVALAEVQGYVYDAKRRMAGLARVRGEEELATRLDAEAETLRARFEAAFWSEEQQFYAMALDGEKHKMDAIGSNAGHCLWTGIVGKERAGHVVRAADGAPTCSAAGASAPTPRGRAATTRSAITRARSGRTTRRSSPPASSATATTTRRTCCAAGSSRRASTSLSSASPSCSAASTATCPPSPSRIPSPARRRPGPRAPCSCSSRRCSASGRTPPAGELELARPELPDWLTKVTVSNLRVGDADVDLLFHRWRGGTSAEVIRKSQDLSVTIRM